MLLQVLTDAPVSGGLPQRRLSAGLADARGRIRGEKAKSRSQSAEEVPTRTLAFLALQRCRPCPAGPRAAGGALFMPVKWIEIDPAYAGLRKHRFKEVLP